MLKYFFVPFFITGGIVSGMLLACRVDDFIDDVEEKRCKRDICSR